MASTVEILELYTQVANILERVYAMSHEISRAQGAHDAATDLPVPYRAAVAQSLEQKADAFRYTSRMLREANRGLLRAV